MAGMVEWWEWQERRDGGMAERMAEWQNGRNEYIRTIYGTRQHRRHQRQRHSNLL